MPSEPIIHAVDDDPRFLSALVRTLRATRHTVNSYTSAGDFLESLDPKSPGCLITDLRMPEIDGLELQRRLAQRQIRLPIIFITGHGNASKAVAALKGGAVDFLEKPFSEQALLCSVGHALDKDANDRKLSAEQAIVKNRFAQLSPREQEVFTLVVSDLPSKEIARRLKISPRTVEHHREHLMLKMQARSLTELVTMAVLCGVRALRL
ncbi:MAG: response regulator transcription factor [Candidatus Dormibacteraceae bacterium]